MIVLESLRKVASLLCMSLVIILLLVSCNRPATATATVADGSQVRVSLIEVKSETYTPEIKSFGSLSFIQKTDLTAPTDGRVVQLLVEEGDRIRKGQRLALLENVQLEIRKLQGETAVQSATAELELTRTRLEEGRRQMEARFLSLDKTKLTIEQKELELERARQLLNDKEQLFLIGGVSEEEIRNLRLQVRGLETDHTNMLVDYEISTIGFRDSDLQEVYGYVPANPEERREKLIELNTRTLRAEVTVAEARVSSAKSELTSITKLIDELTIVGPYDGVVGARYVEVGERVQPSAQILTTFVTDPVYAVFPVQESQIASISLGLQAQVTVPSLSSTRLNAEVVQISPTIDPQSGNIIVKALLQGGSHEFRPGMFFQVSVRTQGTASRITVPESSVVRTDSASGRVFIYRNDRVFSRTVGLGVKAGSAIVVNEGLEEGELIVDSPPQLLRDGTEVLIE